jgi:predicted unusual protein kinase regulating ubiquinone biosynthesis (AarF/ABC1/UbiB family)
LAASGVDATLALRRGVKAWVESVLVGEEFHGDVHAGNVWVLDDGRSCFLDFGIMGSLPEEWRESMRSTFYTVMIDGDFSRIARSLKQLGVLGEDSGSDHEIGLRLQLLFGPLLQRELSELSLAEIGKMLIDLSKQYNGTAPRELTLVVKQLAYFERYAKAIAPDWVLARDLYLVRNVFPEDVERKASELGISLPA